MIAEDAESNIQKESKKKSLLVKGVDVDKYIEDVYESSAKKAESVYMIDEQEDSNN